MIDVDLDSINAHASAAADRQRLDNAINAVLTRYRTVPLDGCDGKVIARVTRDEDDLQKLILVFEDGTYLGLEHDREFGVCETSVDLEVVQRLGLMAPEDIATYNEAVDAVEATRQEAARQRELKALLAFYGADRLRELIDLSS